MKTNDIFVKLSVSTRMREELRELDKRFLPALTLLERVRAVPGVFTMSSGPGVAAGNSSAGTGFSGSAEGETG